jgi:capsular exopolysaccharide synthesis family protein
MELVYENRPINFKKIWRTFLKYRWKNLFIIFSFILLGTTYHLLSTKKYEPFVTVHIKNIPAELQRDFFGNSVGGASPDIETEMDILKSDFLLEKSIKKIDKDVRYFNYDGFKKKEYYKNAPFIVTNYKIFNKKIYGREIEIVDLGDKFKLHIKKSISDYLKPNFLVKPEDRLEDFTKIYPYGSIAITKDIALRIVKRAPFKGSKIRFQINSMEALLKSTKKDFNVITASKDSSVIKATYKDNISKRAKDFLNSLLENYISYSAKEQIEDKSKQLEFVNKQLSDMGISVKDAENSLEKFKSQNSITDIEVQTAELIRKIGELENSLQEAQIEYKNINQVVQRIKRGEYASLSSMGQNYPAIGDLLRTLEENRVRRNELLANYTNRHPDVVSLNRSIQDLKNSIKSIAYGIKDNAKEKIATIKKELNSSKEMLQKLPTIDKRLGQFERKFEINNNIYRYLLEKQSELSIEKAALSSNKKVLDFAKELREPSNLKLPFIILLSTLFGVVASLIYTIFKAKSSDKIDTVETLSEITKIPVFGSIPKFNGENEKNRSHILANPNSPVSESIRKIRELITYTYPDDKSQVILATSSKYGEGKTTLASSLVAAFALADKKSIVLSLDLRNPTLHKSFGLPNSSGVVNLLRGEVELKKAIWEHSVYENLNIITSGPTPNNPSELIASKKMGELIEELKKEYDYIILDTPPLNDISDTISLLKYSDINLFVVREDYSDEKSLIKLNSFIERLGIKNSAIIFNATTEINFIKNENRTSLLLQRAI